MKILFSQLHNIKDHLIDQSLFLNIVLLFLGKHFHHKGISNNDLNKYQIATTRVIELKARFRTSNLLMKNSCNNLRAHALGLEIKL